MTTPTATEFDPAGWFKASRSGGQNGCVEVNLTLPHVVGVRDSKLGARSPVLVFTAPPWRQLRHHIRH